MLWHKIEPRLTGAVAAAGAVVATALLDHHSHVAEAGLVLFGSAPLFWLAMKANLGLLQRINDRWDISYGVYLYGWPAAMIILSLVPGIRSELLGIAALAVSTLCGALSITVALWCDL